MNLLKKFLSLFLFVPFFVHTQLPENPEPLPRATKSQASEWIAQHAVAWDEYTKLVVEIDDCRLQVLRENKSTIMNFSGVLFPIEIIAKGSSKDPYVRVRFKDRYSGDYGMEKECNASNSFCRDNIGKWSPLSFFDFTITSVTDYIGRDNDINIAKASQLSKALNYYARTCNATDYNFRF